MTRSRPEEVDRIFKLEIDVKHSEKVVNFGFSSILNLLRCISELVLIKLLLVIDMSKCSGPIVKEF